MNIYLKVNGLSAATLSPTKSIVLLIINDKLIQIYSIYNVND